MGNFWHKEIPKQIIIIGGGNSIQEHIPGLWHRLHGKWTIGLNFSYRFFESSMTMFVDTDKFYDLYYDEVKNLEMVVGQQGDNINDKASQARNTILLPCVNKYYRDIRNGVYQPCLVGVFALTVAIHLLGDEGEIFLLGYDFGAKKAEKEEEGYRGMAVEDITDKPSEDIKTTKNNILYRGDKAFRPITHWYQNDFEHRGLGKVAFYYQSNKAERIFGCYKNEQKIKIYNVGLDSRIPDTIFPKISYNNFYDKLDGKKYCQDCIRNWTKVKLIRAKSWKGGKSEI